MDAGSSGGRERLEVGGGDNRFELRCQRQRIGRGVVDEGIIEVGADLNGVIDDRDASCSEHLQCDERDVGEGEAESGEAAIVDAIELLRRDVSVVDEGEAESSQLVAVDVDLDAGIASGEDFERHEAKLKAAAGALAACIEDDAGA